MVEILTVTTHKQGLVEFTTLLEDLVSQAEIESGICNLHIQHTSASLLIQENADPSAQADLENWINRLVPERDRLYTHIYEGLDDMPAHIKSALTATSLSIPIFQGRLCLGTWQGVFCWEHRHAGGRRKIAVHIGL